jgi:hypothetical protein
MVPLNDGEMKDSSRKKSGDATNCPGKVDSEGPAIESKSKSEIEQLADAGFALGPFAFMKAVEDKLRSDFRFELFCGNMKDQFVELKPLNTTLECLYDTCIQAHVEKLVINKAREIMRPRDWHRSWLELRRLSQTLRNGGAVQFEGRLRFGLGNHEASRTRRSARKLAKNIFALSRVCSWWEGLATSERWKKYYAGYIWVLNKQLAQTFKTKDERADIIAAAIKLMKVESRVSKDSVLRSLTRERVAPRRFVFKDFGEMTLVHHE